MDAIAALYQRFRDGNFDLAVDSRLVTDPARTAFFALPGQRQDGHAYIPDLYARGVRTFVVREAQLPPAVGMGDWHVVADPLRVLQQLAAHHRRQFADLPVFGITGSNGKTIVKDWLTQVLRTRYRVCASPRSYNSQIGVPLSVWQLDRSHEVAVFEVGISAPGEMAALAAIVQPTHGILTNLGTAHLQNFRGKDQLVREKLLLFQDCQQLFMPSTERDVVNASLPAQTELHWVDTLTSSGSTPQSEVFRHNVSLVRAAAEHLGISSTAVARMATTFTTPSNRLERREGRDGEVIINDSYSNDFSALAAALTFAEGQDPFGSLTLILGEVQALPDLSRRLAVLIEGRVHRLLLVGENHVLHQEGLAAETFSDAGALLAALPELSFAGQTVLVKGSSGQQLDRVADALSRRLHRTVLHVDLSALRHNFLAYRQSLPPEVRMIVMTKAAAYGSGALPVARVMQQVGADYLAVAYPEEGRALREGGITLPILVLNPEPYSFGLLARYQLEAVVHDREQLRRAVEAALPVHLKLDTGMARLGFSPATFVTLLQDDLLRQAQLRTIFTHLAGSDEAQHDAFTRQQLTTFDTAYQHYLDQGYPPVPRHALNTNGISRFPDHAYQLVRLGIGVYGIGDAKRSDQLQPALRLTTTITALTERAAGETVGYGRRGQLTERRTIAVLSIGYADGLPRQAGQGRFAVRVRGQLAPTVGSICMDMCMVDVTGVAGTQVGDVVTVFGPDHPVELLATAAMTIPYEILTGIGERVHRVYTGE